MLRFSAVGRRLALRNVRSSGALVASGLLPVALASLSACSNTDSTYFPAPELPGVAQGNPEFLGFPERAEDWADSPPLLSQTLAFEDVAALQPSAGLLPYGVQSPLFSD